MRNFTVEIRDPDSREMLYFQRLIVDKNEDLDFILLNIVRLLNEPRIIFWPSTSPVSIEELK